MSEGRRGKGNEVSVREGGGGKIRGDENREREKEEENEKKNNVEVTEKEKD